tara:strand:- start:5783 stop:6100 length:318 start_codon:yes stop_codon:yes gene_type:complete
MRSYEEKCDLAFKLSSLVGFLSHGAVLEMILRAKLASSVEEADKMIRDGERQAIAGTKPAPLKRPPRYDPIMQEAEDDLAKRHGRQAAQVMIDEEERQESYGRRR